MWNDNWRDRIWEQLDEEWDLLIVGGGITGAGILREATRLGLRALLVEKKDFAWGTSSRSSKLVHGGLRYLKEGKFGLTRVSVHERQQLLADGPGLIDPLGFLLASYQGDKVSRLVYQAGLTVYDLLALQWSHRFYDTADFRMLAPHLTESGLKGGFRYGDAQTDDARLVLRVIREAVAAGGTALNYTTAVSLLRDEEGQVCGARLHDAVGERSAETRARLVINATGAWADRLRQEVDKPERIRPLRGSHLVFPRWHIPVAQAVSFLHPIDQRPIMIFPWEGMTLVGTTDVDHNQEMDQEPRISPEEVAYLMAAIQSQFPSLGLTLDHVIAAFAGVRPVIGSGKVDPSQESRDHVVWQENGLLTVTGGKMTTFRVIAQDALRHARDRLPDMPPMSKQAPVLDPIEVDLEGELDEEEEQRLLGRYGADAPALVAAAEPGELEPIPRTNILWAELRWAARAEGVIHLDDLLLRRVRLGVLSRRGGAEWLPRIRQICQPALGWDDARWEAEEAAYLEVIDCCYSLPPRESIPDWGEMLAEAKEERREETAVAARRWSQIGVTAVSSALLSLLTLLLWRRRRRTGAA